MLSIFNGVEYDLTNKSKLGSGCYAEVHAIQDGLAVKEFKDTYDLHNRIHEFCMATFLDHPNILPIVDLTTNENGLNFIMPKSDDRLDRYIGNNPHLDMPARLGLCYELCSVVHALHSNQMIHGDIQYANVLFIDGHIKIIDFGIASRQSFAYTAARYQSTYFKSPESLSALNITKYKVDDKPNVYTSEIWAVGLLCLTILTGNNYVHGPTFEEKIYKYIMNPWVIWGSVKNPHKAFLQKMLAVRVHERYQSMDEVLDYFKGFIPIPYFINCNDTDILPACEVWSTKRVSLLIEWLYEVCESHRMNIKYLFITLEYLRIYMSVPTSIKELQLYASCMLYIACLSVGDTIEHLSLKRLIYLSGTVYTKQQFLDGVYKVIKNFQGKLAIKSLADTFQGLTYSLQMKNILMDADTYFAEDGLQETAEKIRITYNIRNNM